jgi:hypothetical protein
LGALCFTQLTKLSYLKILGVEKMQTITQLIKTNRIILCSILSIGLFVFGCENNQKSSSLNNTKGEKVASGKLTGRATWSPISPVVRKDMPSPYEPADGVKFVILTPSGKEIQSVITDKQGRYSVDLPPGTYRVEMSRSPLGFTKDLPTEVAIAENQETRMDIRLDTGIR